MKISSKMEKCGLSPMRKFNGYAAEAVKRGIKIYHLNIGQPDIITPDAYFQAMREFSEPVLAYAPSRGVPVLLDAVRGYYGNIGVELADENILVTTGGSEALQMTMATILDDGDEIIIPEPFYPNYHTSVTLAGATIRPLTTYPEEGYRYAVRERIEPLINEHTRAIMITNPGNPTGAVQSPEELKLMLDIAKEHDLFIICDEVYREFTYGGEPLTSALQYPGYEDNVIVIDSVSKRFSACGARIGLLISKNKEFMQQAMKWCQCRLCASTTDQVAAAALYSVDKDYFASVREEYKLRRDTLMSKLSQIPGVVCKEPKGAFYVMAALPVDDADKFQLWLLNEFEDNGETVMFSCGEPFYATPGKGLNEVRMAYVINKEDIARAMDILAVAIRKYNETH
ncbi:MAG: pyridoxal phosphate-dependent aminotransferase [Candidatus Limivicinus sp.]|nr:pyridoxal phosphate-dependent aminotransferase [Candidatus Limivicinus sp.]